MAEHIRVVPDELRQAAHRHRETAEQLSAVPAGHAGIMASLESLGPIFGELVDAGRELLDQRRACYEQQAAAHADFADSLVAAAELWEHQDAGAASQLRGVIDGGP